MKKILLVLIIWCIVVAVLRIGVSLFPDLYKGTALSSYLPQKAAEIHVENYTYGGEIHIAITAEPMLLDPLSYKDAYSIFIMTPIFNSLFYIDENFVMRPDLVKEWKVKNNYRSWELSISPNITWHDGTALTTEDIAFTIQKYLQLRKLNGKSQLDLELSIVDRDTIKIEVKKIDMDFFGEVLSLPIIPQHIYGQVDTPENVAPVGSGPFIFDYWTKGEEVVLKANLNYYKGRPYLDSIHYKLIKSPQDGLEKLKNGLLDAMYVPEEYNHLVRKMDHVDVHNMFGFAYEYLGYNLEDPLLQNQDVRFAIAYAIDRKTMLAEIFHNEVVAAWSHYSSISFFNNQDLKKTMIQYQPDMSEKIFTELGWVKNRAGYWEKEGEILTVQILTNQETERRLKTLDFIAMNLQGIGMRVKKEILPAKQMVAERLKKGDFQIFLGGFVLSPDQNQYSIWHSSQIENGMNFFRLRDPEMDRLLEKVKSNPGKRELKENHSKIQDHLLTVLPSVPLYYRQDFVAVNKKFVLPKPPTSAGVFLHISKWYIKQNEEDR